MGVEAEAVALATAVLVAAPVDAVAAAVAALVALEELPPPHAASSAATAGVERPRSAARRSMARLVIRPPTSIFGSSIIQRSLREPLSRPAGRARPQIGI